MINTTNTKHMINFEFDKANLLYEQSFVLCDQSEKNKKSRKKCMKWNSVKNFSETKTSTQR